MNAEGKKSKALQHTCSAQNKGTDIQHTGSAAYPRQLEAIAN
jgi:hypothetical protein